MGLVSSFPPRAARTTPGTRLPQRTSTPYKATCRIVDLLINMIALMGRCQTAILRFSGFPAVSLPRLRFGRRVARKMLIRSTFRFEASPEKIFTLSFPSRQGKREAALPCRLSSLRRRRRFSQGSGSLHEISAPPRCRGGRSLRATGYGRLPRRRGRGRRRDLGRVR